MGKIKVFRLALLLISICLTGCASPQPQQYYRLSSWPPAQVESGERPNELSLGIGPLRLADYLDQPRLACRLDDHRLKLAEFHQWAGSLKDNLSAVMAENLGSRLQTEKVYLYPWRSSTAVDLQVKLDIIELDGSPGQEARLTARWSICKRPEKRLLTTRHSVFRQTISGSSYADLVAAQSRLLADLSAEIAQAIRQSTAKP